MHEYSLIQAMFDQIGDAMRANRAIAVRRVHVRIGRFAGVEPELFRTAYDVFRVKRAAVRTVRAAWADEWGEALAGVVVACVGIVVLGFGI